VVVVPTVVSGWRRFHLRGLGFGLLGQVVPGFQANAARILSQAWAICSAHRQLRSIRSLV
jgi:hypothetical protein